MSNTMILQSHKALDKIAYKIVCKASGPIDFVSAQENVSTMFENKFHVVRNSLKHQGDNLYSMIIKANVKSIAADLIGPKSNKVEITAGIYTDASDNSIWKMEEVNGERRLVMMEPEDLEACFHYGKSIQLFMLHSVILLHFIIRKPDPSRLVLLLLLKMVKWKPSMRKWKKFL